MKAKWMEYKNRQGAALIEYGDADFHTRVLGSVTQYADGSYHVYAIRTDARATLDTEEEAKQLLLVLTGATT